MSAKHEHARALRFDGRAANTYSLCMRIIQAVCTAAFREIQQRLLLRLFHAYNRSRCLPPLLFRWVDEKTRAVFVEFLLFNPNMNLFAVSQMLVEFTQWGGRPQAKTALSHDKLMCAIDKRTLSKFAAICMSKHVMEFCYVFQLPAQCFGFTRCD